MRAASSSVSSFPKHRPSTNENETTTASETDELEVLIASLHLEDINEITHRAIGKGKAREDASLKDEEVAFKLYAEDLEAYLLRQEDIRLAKSLDESSNSDDESLQEDNELDEVAWKDREIALCAAGSGRTPVTAVNATTSERCHMLEDKASSSNSVSREPTTTYAHSSEPSSSQLQECVICCITVPRDAMYIASCPSRHIYHSRCLLALIHASMKDESLMPPVCCKVGIDENLFLPLLNKEDRDEFIRKREEFGTKDRLYCNNVSCSAFLGAVEREAKQPKKCDRCGNETCKACKGPWHGYKSICAGDSDEAAIDLLRDIGMQRCPGCLRMVELIDGCYHIDEDRLLQEATQRVRRDEPRGYFARFLDAILFRREVAALRYHHECRYAGHWERVEGIYECENCFETMLEYIFECSECRMRACNRCRMNRFM
ncbi:hypothetical protein FA10DRAFT_279030 [Acaromyces ingoldii]|uniref:IBR domain-containing protein n=1 Tax=Acaromyces ingoldii TaxID=215250 RepID=A0A316YV41_9BASI|nr:hypothetical protein FA10DRAFT_279030 [Acaromyces ingoldii]PWN92508.1 hypothetical protein FA10DRAFT_279030 [Acaromyces ingoldii]